MVFFAVSTLHCTNVATNKSVHNWTYRIPLKHGLTLSIHNSRATKISALRQSSAKCT